MTAGSRPLPSFSQSSSLQCMEMASGHRRFGWGSGVDLFEGQNFCFFSWIFRGFALLCLPFTVVRFFVFFRGFFVNLCYSGFLFRQSDFSFFSWIFREFALLWLPFAALRFFVFFVPPTPSLIGVFTSGGPGTKNRCRTEMTLTNF